MHTISNQPKLSYYCKFKSDFCFEKYLDVLDKTSFQQTMSRFRLSSHNLEIESGRFVGLDRNDRICTICTRTVESEYHFMLCCTLYRELRIKYNICSSFPTLNKFYYLMSSKSTKTIRNVSKFIKYAMKLRADFLVDIAAP